MEHEASVTVPMSSFPPLINYSNVLYMGLSLKTTQEWQLVQNTPQEEDGSYQLLSNSKHYYGSFMLEIPLQRGA